MCYWGTCSTSNFGQRDTDGLMAVVCAGCSFSMQFCRSRRKHTSNSESLGSRNFVSWIWPRTTLLTFSYSTLPLLTIGFSETCGASMSLSWIQVHIVRFWVLPCFLLDVPSSHMQYIPSSVYNLDLMLSTPLVTGIPALFWHTYCARFLRDSFAVVWVSSVDLDQTAALSISGGIVVCEISAWIIALFLRYTTPNSMWHKYTGTMLGTTGYSVNLEDTILRGK